jgi:hypothetical protein
LTLPAADLLGIWFDDCMDGLDIDDGARSPDIHVMGVM